MALPQQPWDALSANTRVPCTRPSLIERRQLEFTWVTFAKELVMIAIMIFRSIMFMVNCSGR